MTSFGYGLPEVDTTVVDANALFVLRNAAHYLQSEGHYVGNKTDAIKVRSKKAAEVLKGQLDRPENGIIHVIEPA